MGGGCDSLCRGRVVGRRGTARREDPRDPWENGSRRADSPRSNASLTVSLSLCALLPHHPFLRLVRRPTPRARARCLSHPHALLCRRASPPIIPPPLSALFRPLSPPRAHREPPDVRPTHLRGYMGARMEMFSPTRQILYSSFLLSLEKYLRP